MREIFDVLWVLDGSVVKVWRTCVRAIGSDVFEACGSLAGLNRATSQGLRGKKCVLNRRFPGLDL